MGAFTDIATSKKVSKRLRREKEERDDRREKAADLAKFPPSYRSRYRREFLLHDPRKERRRTIAYLVMVGVFVLLFALSIILQLTR